MVTDVYEQILEETFKIIQEADKKRVENGYDMNIFSVLDIERKEQYVHENMLYEILTFMPNKEIAEIFVAIFLETIGLPKSFLNLKWEIEHQYYTASYGTMDIFMKSKGKIKKCIVIELKIDASDGEKQLQRYWNYAQKSNYTDCRIVYLTLDGREASEQSIGKVPKNKRINISYKRHILSWLEQCLQICDEEEIEASFLKQYWILLNKLVGEDDMSKQVCEVIKNKEDLRACIELSKALPDIQSMILYNFLKKINDGMERKGFENICTSSKIEDAKEYYEKNKSVRVEMEYQVKEYQVGKGKRLKLILGIGVYYTLYFYFGFHLDGEYVDSDEIFKKQKRIYQKIKMAISESLLNREINDKQSTTSIYDESIKDCNNNKYDFKHFSSNCINLMDEKVLNSEANRISRKMSEYIKHLQVALED